MYVAKTAGMRLAIMLILIACFLIGCHRQETAEDSNFTEFIQSDSDFFTIARTIMPYDKVPSDARVVYHHKSVGDGREYAEITIFYPNQNAGTIQEYAERQAQTFAQGNVGKSPYFCMEEDPFQMGETVFQCYTFAVQESNQQQADYYGFAVGYNEGENSVVYVFFSDEALSYSEPDYLLSQFYP